MKEKQLIEKIKGMGEQSLNPDMFCDLEKILKRLEKTRHIEREPKDIKIDIFSEIHGNRTRFNKTCQTCCDKQITELFEKKIKGYTTTEKEETPLAFVLLEAKKSTLKLICCKIGCGKKAEYIINTDKPYDDVHSCLECIPELMTDSSRHYVDKIEED